MYKKGIVQFLISIFNIFEWLFYKTGLWDTLSFWNVQILQHYLLQHVTNECAFPDKSSSGQIFIPYNFLKKNVLFVV